MQAVPENGDGTSYTCQPGGGADSVLSLHWQGGIDSAEVLSVRRFVEAGRACVQCLAVR